GCDIQSKFIVSGFQSFKALSLSPCKPFDKDRDGLNLGEASAAMILSSAPCFTRDLGWTLVSGSIRNDANHISGPSRTGEGSYRALIGASGGSDKENIAFVNVHGTSTPYNDEMESIALGRAGLNEYQINALKGNYGHTMGAAGIVESIISMKAVERGIVLPTKGFENMGVSVPVSVSSETRTTAKRSFVKLLSGFGGCNAAALFSMDIKEPLNVSLDKPSYRIVHSVEISPEAITLDGESISVEGCGRTLLDNAYRKYVGDYPKYFKMDTHCKAGFVASELLLKGEDGRFNPRSDRSVVLMGSTSSLCNDVHYQETIQSEDNYYPSPSLFVYTLANIITGEISIRNKYLGETSFYVLPKKDEKLMERFLNETFMDKEISSALFGWIDCYSDDNFHVSMSLVQTIDR
ncbi:MAG: 3-oxoacyl-ACP synthase, partial [Bacteroidales bacterium]|nr:3-oxoacyl-ACP synthase [Bacteroidales bacterium]